MKVISTKTCSSLSGKSTITYKLGRDEANALYIRLHENTGGGFFNDDWYPAQELADSIQAAASSEGLTSTALRPLFRGRSANTPAFYSAVLRNEGALLPYKRTVRRHLVGDLEAFLTQTESTTPPVKRKTAAKKKASKKTSSRKTTKKTSVEKT